MSVHGSGGGGFSWSTKMRGQIEHALGDWTSSSGNVPWSVTSVPEKMINSEQVM